MTKYGRRKAKRTKGKEGGRSWGKLDPNVWEGREELCIAAFKADAGNWQPEGHPSSP